MLLKLSAHIEPYSENQFIAWVDNEKFKGTIVQAATPTAAWKELLTSIKVKIAYDYNIDINSMEEKEISKPDDLIDFELHDGKKDVNLILQ